jgi:predicted pyridoxine 5'-phosphate oxidase superfamily flavin-nucleotide-binding protein
MVRGQIPAEYAYFLEEARFVYVAAADDHGRVWASVLSGPAGFMRALTPARVDVRAAPAADDPLSAALGADPRPVGMLVLEPMSRSRIRLNGFARRTDAGLTLELRECFGNCPKYIQRRRPIAVASPPPVGAPAARASAALDRQLRAMVAAADTFVIGSRHPQRGADASHRGGRPGFVAAAADGRSLTFPDYPGNTMFQTLGNLAVDPAVGLLFVDWDTGRTLQIAGRATIDWDSARIAAWEGAERLIDVAIDAVVERAAGLPVVWELVERHRLNPAVPDPDPPVPGRG